MAIERMTQELLKSSGEALARFGAVFQRGRLYELARLAGANPTSDILTGDSAVSAVPGIYAISSLGGPTYNQTFSDSLELLSDDADDTSGGSGARTVRAELLNLACTPSIVDITPAGLTVVGLGVLTGPFMYVNKFWVQAAGASKTNEGTITLRRATGDLELMRIMPGRSVSSGLQYTVPEFKRGILECIKVGASALTPYNIWLHMDQNPQGVRTPGVIYKYLIQATTLGSDGHWAVFDHPIVLDGCVHIEIFIEQLSAAGFTAVGRLGISVFPVNP
jgi:hypothetical protein